MMTPEQCCGKPFEFFVELLATVTERAKEAERADKVEREVFAGVLKLGRALLDEFFAQAGDGDSGEELVHEGQSLKRMDSLSVRNYHSVFGVVEVSRRVYAVRERQATVAPLDAPPSLSASRPNARCSRTFKRTLNRILRLLCFIATSGK